VAIFILNPLRFRSGEGDQSSLGNIYIYCMLIRRSKKIPEIKSLGPVNEVPAATFLARRTTLSDASDLTEQV